ncbi:MAG: hypothetical protein ABFD81_09615 [Syntrophaceae bacterium]
MTKQYLIEEAGLESMVSLVTNDNWAEYTLRYIVDYKKHSAIKDMTCELLLEWIDETHGHIRIGWASRELSAVSDLAVKVLQAQKQ